VHPWIPAEALRIESRSKGAVVVYSSHTGPSEELVRLSRGADLLLHEATRLESGHGSAEQAGAIADQSSVKRLWLIHFGPSADREALGVRAPSPSSDLVEVAQDGMELALQQAEARSLQSIKLAKNAYGTILWGRAGRKLVDDAAGTGSLLC